MTSLPDLKTDIWTTASQRCWKHIEVATTMSSTIEALRGCHATSAIPILSDNMPTLMLTPEYADDLVHIKATARFIERALLNAGLLEKPTEWKKIDINDEWMLRLVVPDGIIIDLMTRLPATKESPIEL